MSPNPALPETRYNHLDAFMWEPIIDLNNVPADRDLRLAVIEGRDVHTLVFPCRRKGDGWVNAETGRNVEVYPTHYQAWVEGNA